MRFAYIFTVLLASGLGCGAPQAQEVDSPMVEPPPQCLPLCQLNLENRCVADATVMDGARTAVQEVDCDPRCCEARYTEATPRDSDGDGIPDDVDQCPNEPEDYDGFQDEDGCPDPDNDGDGIPDVDDLCPLDPEDFDGFQDEDGCPD